MESVIKELREFIRHNLDHETYLEISTDLEILIRLIDIEKQKSYIRGIQDCITRLEGEMKD